MSFAHAAFYRSLFFLVGALHTVKLHWYIISFNAHVQVSFIDVYAHLVFLVSHGLARPFFRLRSQRGLDNDASRLYAHLQSAHMALHHCVCFA